MNAITKFKKYTDLLDEVYAAAAKSAVLESDATLATAGANANEIVIPKLTMDGLADYSRNGGYVDGDVTLTNETVQFNFDRGRTFSVDNMDDEETAGLAFGKLSAEFIRTKVTPELDAFRFAKYSGLAGTKVEGTLSDGNAVLSALVAAASALDEASVSEGTRYLFITPSLYNAVEAVDSYKSREVLASFAQVVKVPQARFYTAIDQLDGTTEGETAGGFVKDSTSGKDINFLIVEKSAVMQYTKHEVNKAISPDENQTSDAWKFFFRSYGLADVYENKVSGVYLHSKAS